MNQEKKQLKELQLQNWLIVLVKLDCCRVVYQSVEATNEVLEVTVTNGKLKMFSVYFMNVIDYK